MSSAPAATQGRSHATYMAASCVPLPAPVVIPEKWERWPRALTLAGNQIFVIPEKSGILLLPHYLGLQRCGFPAFAWTTGLS